MVDTITSANEALEFWDCKTFGVTKQLKDVYSILSECYEQANDISSKELRLQLWTAMMKISAQLDQ
jgi:phage-related minor tail protein